jgi:hypothetical protein
LHSTWHFRKMVLLHSRFLVLWFFFLLLLLSLLPLTIVRAQIRCSRCDQRSVRSSFLPRWDCFLPQPHVLPTCDCPQDGYDRSTYTCIVIGRECACTLNADRLPQNCPAGKQTVAYRCDDTLYVCWNMVPPQVLDLVDDTGNTCPLTDNPITDLVYCDGGDRNPFKFDTEGLCGNWCDTAESATHCPNGKAISETFRITAPLRSGYLDERVGNPANFCDYRGISLTDDWVVDQVVQTPYSCPQDVIVDNDNGMCHALVDYAEPECKVNYQLLEGSGSGTQFAVSDFSHPVSFYFSEVADIPTNRRQTCAFTVTVEDVEPPTVTCPDNVVIVAPGNQCFSVVAYDPPVASDNCGLDPSKVTILPAGYTSGGVFPAGATTITLDATDPSDNRSTCSFQIQVNTNPSACCFQAIITCPANLVVREDPALCGGAAVTYSVTSQNPNNVMDTILPVQVQGLPSGSFFPIGTTEMLFEASLPGAGSNCRRAGCRFTVSVLEEEKGKGGLKCKKGKKKTKQPQKNEAPKKKNRAAIRVRA